MLQIIAAFSDLDGCVIHEFATDGKCIRIVVWQAGKARVFEPKTEQERDSPEQVRARLLKHDGKITFDNLPKA